MYDAATIGTLHIGLGYVRSGSVYDQARAGKQRESTVPNPRVRRAIARGLRTVAARLEPVIA